MILDKIEGFNALKHFDIRVVRSKYVDSPEDAIAFAGRREADDHRALPIVLDAVGANGAAHNSIGPLTDHAGIRQAYRSLEPLVERLDGRLLAKDFIPAGTDIAIEGRRDGKSGKCIVLRSKLHSAQRTMPLDSDGAEMLVTHFQAHGHPGPRDKTGRMLEHLLMRISAFFQQGAVEALEIEPRIHENSYTVVDAIIAVRAPLHLKERLDPHAHDRRGYGYHPSGRQ